MTGGIFFYGTCGFSQACRSIYRRWITYCDKLSTDIHSLYSRLRGWSGPTSEQLRDEYDELCAKIKKTTDLKWAAIEKCNQMLHGEAAPLRGDIDEISSKLKKHHKMLMNQITEMVHEGQIQFPIQSQENCLCHRIRRFFIQNAGWIVTGYTGSFALMTLTPLGGHIGPALANTPQSVGEACRSIGVHITKILTSEEFKSAAQSPWMDTLGKISLVAATIYPIYWYLEDPISKTIQTVLESTGQDVDGCF